MASLNPSYYDFVGNYICHNKGLYHGFRDTILSRLVTIHQAPGAPVYPGLVSCPFYAVPTINPWHACTARVTVLGLCVCMFVCLLATTILALQATRRFMGDTNSFSAVYKGIENNMAILLKQLCSRDMV